MTIPAATTLDEAILTADPLALPPQRRMMVCLMLALAALLHIVTNGWGPIENGRDGMNAAISRELALGLDSAQISQLWGENIAATPVQWVTALSFQIFGANEFAARLPFGLASVLVVWLVFLTGEKLGGMWRGLACGIIAATTSGAILHGRDGGGATFTAGVFCVGLYAALRMLEQNSRVVWQGLFWVAEALLLGLGQGLAATLLILGICSAALAFREARIRLRLPWFATLALLFWGMLLLFFPGQLAGLMHWDFPDSSIAQKILWTLFPWSIVALPPCLLRMGKIFRPRDFSPADAVLWSLGLALFLWMALTPPSAVWPSSAACLWPVFALLAGLVWERFNSGQRILGIAFLIVLSLAGMTFCGRVAGKDWLNLLQPIWWLSCGVIVVFGISAIISVALRHSRAALLTLAASIVPLAFNLLDARVRYNWAGSMKDLGARAEMNYRPSSRVFVTEDLEAVSSFLFYAPHDLKVRKIPCSSLKNPGLGDYLLWPRTQPPVFPNLENLGGNRTHVLSAFTGH